MTRRLFSVTGPRIAALLLGGGASFNDLVSLIDAEDYFRAREVQTSIDGLKELAGKEPKDARGQVSQLLAIRLLGELKIGNADEKQRIVAALAPIAAGTRAQDRDGFAKRYAQRAVARLVASGSSNRETAAELVISVKTVEFHLRNVYQKLGIASRGQLKAALAEH